MIAIIGGGLAGCGLVKVLFEKGVEFEWYIDGITSASHISSGIINPISGRNYALSWNYDLFYEFAQSFYNEKSQSFIDDIIIRRKIYPSNKPELQHQRFEELSKYIKMEDDTHLLISHCSQVKVKEFITFWTDTLKRENKVILANVNAENVNPLENTVFGKQYEYILFAEGIKVLNNPIFNTLPFFPNRGEALEVEIDTYVSNQIVHDKHNLCPFGENFWIGSSFERVEIGSPLHTEIMYNTLSDSLQYITDKKPFKIINHLGAFRSTTLDRKPIIGSHPDYSTVVLFNGFGSKGASLVPYYAHQLIENLLNNTPIDFSVSIDRFY